MTEQQITKLFDKEFRDVVWDSELEREKAHSYFKAGALSLLKETNNNSKYKETCEKAIEFLNTERKRISKGSAIRGFKLTDSVKKNIVARLKEGHTIDDFQKVITFKCDQWKNSKW